MKTNRIVAAILLVLLTFLPAMPAFSQANLGEPVAGVAINRSTVSTPAIITTGNTFQTVLASNLGTATQRQALTIENNNATDNCRIIIGGPWLAGDTTSTTRTVNGVSVTGTQASILLTAGGSYSRYWPFVPSDAILATCTSSGDSLYVDNN